MRIANSPLPKGTVPFIGFVFSQMAATTFVVGLFELILQRLGYSGGEVQPAALGRVEIMPASAPAGGLTVGGIQRELSPVGVRTALRFVVCGVDLAENVHRDGIF